MSRAKTPALRAIVKYWRSFSPDEMSGIFPKLQAFRTDWGEPFCFKCGWLTPSPDGDETSWQMASGWLERAHLADWSISHANYVSDLVPLCVLCHRTMPSFSKREPAISWVADRVDQPKGWQQLTDFTFGLSDDYREVRKQAIEHLKDEFDARLREHPERT